MMDVVQQIDWGKCPQQRVPLIVERPRQWASPEIWWIPKEDIQSVFAVNVTYPRFNRTDGWNFHIDCDGDALFCRPVNACDYFTLPRDVEVTSFTQKAMKWHSGLMTHVWEKTFEGLIPALALDCTSGQPLMLAWLDEAALRESIATGTACYFSRSRKRLWRKGEQSGNVQRIREMRCYLGHDFPHTVIFDVEQIGGAACHDGYRSCFYRHLKPRGTVEVVEERLFDPKQVYKQGERS